MNLSERYQFWAFALLVLASVAVGLAPVVVTGLMGKTIPDALIANSDKTVTGLIGVLGTLAGLIFRRSGSDDTASAFRAIEATAKANTTPEQRDV